VHIVNHSRRTEAAFLLFLFFFIFSLARLFYIQFFRSDFLAELAKKQHNFYMELEPQRGTIYDTNLKPQAVNLACDSLYASPNEIADKDKDKIIRQLAPILNFDYTYLKERLWRNKAFIWLARKVTAQQSDAIKKLNLKGIGFIKESKRCYPNGYLASQAVGFAGLDNNGLEGLELYYDQYLRGDDGWAFILRDARSKKLDIYEKIMLPKDGYDLVLTIDEVIQYIAERELDKAFKASGAKGASIAVMNPRTGEVLALANRPTFEQNQLSGVTKDQIRNRSICDLFEPGSVFKIVTACAALEEDKVKEEDRFFCENGEYKVANHILHDHRPHGWLVFREVIEQSSNIGTCKVAQILGPEIISRYIKLFGFGVKSGIDLPGEISGKAKDVRGWSKTSIAAIPMGQEVGVTVLQLVNAISVIANGGQLMRPYIVKEIRDKQGQTIKAFLPTPIRQVIRPETAARVTKILIGVIEKGTGKLAKIPNFTAAGKTGTAQKIEPSGAYSHNKFVASFIGFAPAQDPEIAVVVTVDEPRGYYFGGVVCAPVFKNVVADVLRYLKTKQTEREILALNEVNAAN
jgi:cell division protein FtsI (penicillin-binding protein 3)